MTQASDAHVQAELERELQRLSEGDPFTVLSLDYSAENDEVRAAFLSATKSYHPNRFGRRAPEVRELATEIFLVIKKSYQAIATDETRTKTLVELGKADDEADDLESSSSDATPRARASARGSRRSFRRGTSRSRSRHAAGTSPPAGAGASSTRPSVRLPRQPTAAEKTAAEASAREERSKAFVAAKGLVRAGDFGGARAAFQELALQDHQERSYRVWMHYAWGKQHEAAGRADDARSEYNRSLTLDPAFAEAQDAVSDLDEKTKKRGVFSRLFRK